MTTTPKSVILAVVVFLGLIVLCIIAGAVVLQLTDNGTLPASIENLGLVALGALAGVLATTRTTPEVPPGAVLTGGQTTLSAAPSPAQLDAGLIPAGTPPTIVNVTAGSTTDTVTAPDLAGAVTTEAQEMVSIDPNSIEGYSVPPLPAPAPETIT